MHTTPLYCFQAILLLRPSNEKTPSSCTGLPNVNAFIAPHFPFPFLSQGSPVTCAGITHSIAPLLCFLPFLGFATLLALSGGDPSFLLFGSQSATRNLPQTIKLCSTLFILARFRCHPYHNWLRRLHYYYFVIYLYCFALFDTLFYGELLSYTIIVIEIRDLP